MSGGLGLVEAEKSIGEIDLCESQVLDIAEPKSGIEAEQECPAYIGILVGVMRQRKLLDFVHREVESANHFTHKACFKDKSDI